MHINKSVLTLSFVLLSSASSFAQSIDISTFNNLSAELQNGSSQSNPINITNNIDFTGTISFNTDNYINDNNYIFNGGSGLDTNTVPLSTGVSGFVTSGGTQVFNNVKMYNFVSPFYGAAINNAGAVVTINDSDFYYNAIYNFSQSEAFNYGGALDNFGGTMNVNNSNFYYNLAGGGAAISNINGTLTVRDSVFKNNVATRDAANDAEGGAIANYSDLYVYDSLFENNSATHGGTTKNAYGGAIFNAQFEEAHIYNSSFINNSADDTGGAIYNDYNLYLYADDGKQTVFSGNVQKTNASNAIHNTCYVALLAEEGGEIIFNDAITSENTAVSAIDIGGAQYNGVVVLNADMTGVNGTTTFKNGTLKIGANMGRDASGYLNMFGTGMIVDTLSTGGKAIFDMANNSRYDTYKTGASLTLNSDMYANIDVNLISTDADKFVDLADATGSANVIIEGINITEDAVVNNLMVTVSENGDDRILLSDDAKIVETPMYTYSVSDALLQSDGTLMFSTKPSSSLLASHSSKKVHATVLTDITKHVLTPNEPTTVVSNASSGDYAYGKPAFWFDAKGLSEDISLDGLTVDNDTYIAIGGFDFEGENYKDWQTTYSVYGGYVGSRQKYENVKTNQDGFVIGVGSRIEKDNIFSALIANFATSFVDGNNAFGNENFDIYSASVASKTGMNYDLYDGKYILKPSVIVGYHYVHTQDYTNASGIKISADDLQVFHVSPELKFVTNFENGFAPYVAAAYHWNIENGGETKANDVLLPTLSVDNYAEFAIGFGQDIGTDIHTYAEAIFTSGNRTGGGAHVGLKYNF